MAGKSVIIIGAGLAGLSTGCYAQMNGYRSHIFEHHAQPGGVATAWKRGDYTIDGGIHFLMGHRPGQSTYRLYEELGAAQAYRFLDMAMYGRFLDEASGRSVEVTADLGRLAGDLKAISPGDSRIIDDLVSGARAMQGFDMFATMREPPGLAGLLGRIKPFWGMRRALKYFGGRYAKPIVEYAQGAHNSYLRWFLENLFMPEVPVWFTLMLMALVADGQMGLLEGGSLGLVAPIEKRYKDLGGRITCDATVEKILVENDTAVGVRLADGREHRADIVASAADGHSTIFKMLDGRYVSEKIKTRYKDWKLVRPMVMVSFGVAREFAGEPWLSVIKLERAFGVGDQVVGGMAVRIFNYSDPPAGPSGSPRGGFAPKGKTVVQAAFETEWDYWDELQKDRPRYEAEKERVAAEVLQRLGALHPGISSQVEMTDVATPYTTWRYTLNHKGAYEGWLPTPEAIRAQVEKTLPGLVNFYMAGQWVMPGGGVPPCLYSGRHVVQILCHRDGQPFRSGA